MRHGLGKRLALVLLCCLVGYAPFAQASPDSQTACRFRPGQPLRGEIVISVHDHEVQADSAIVRLDTHIPAGGRETPTGSYIAPPHPTIPVHLAKDTLKHFSVRPHIVVDNYRSSDCRLRFDSIIGNRSWALQEKTDFTIRTTVLVNGIKQNYQTEVSVSCLDADVPVRLASGALVPIKNVVAGDSIRDPLTHKALAVKAVIWGPEADEKMYRIGFGQSVGLFTSQHPILTRRGLVPAGDVTVADSVLGEDGSYHKVTIRSVHEGDAARAVYNLQFISMSEDVPEHVFAANGIVVGDFDLQNRLQDGRREPATGKSRGRVISPTTGRAPGSTWFSDWTHSL